MVDIVVSSVLSVVLLFFSAVLLKYEEIKKDKKIAALTPKNRKQLIFGIGMIISVCALTACLIAVYKVGWIYIFKRLTVVSLLWVLALIDFRKHIIPNKILISMIIIRALIVIFELIFERKGIKAELFGSLIACVGVLLILCLMRLAVKNGIGFGDVKLFAVIGLFLGIQGTIAAVFMSFIVSFFVSLFLLISKRKSKKDYIAFAPFILAGTYISVFFLGA